MGPEDDRVDGWPRVDPSDGVETGVGAADAGEADGRSDMSNWTADSFTIVDGVGCCTSALGVVAAARSGEGSGALAGTVLGGTVLGGTVSNVDWPPSLLDWRLSSSGVREDADDAPACRGMIGRWEEELKAGPGRVPTGKDMCDWDAATREGVEPGTGTKEVEEDAGPALPLLTRAFFDSASDAAAMSRSRLPSPVLANCSAFFTPPAFLMMEDALLAAAKWPSVLDDLLLPGRSIKDRSPDAELASPAVRLAAGAISRRTRRAESTSGM